MNILIRKGTDKMDFSEQNNNENENWTMYMNEEIYNDRSYTGNIYGMRDSDTKTIYVFSTHMSASPITNLVGHIFTPEEFADMRARDRLPMPYVNIGACIDGEWYFERHHGPKIEIKGVFKFDESVLAHGGELAFADAEEVVVSTVEMEEGFRRPVGIAVQVGYKFMIKETGEK